MGIIEEKTNAFVGAFKTLFEAFKTYPLTFICFGLVVLNGIQFKFIMDGFAYRMDDQKVHYNELRGLVKEEVQRSPEVKGMKEKVDSGVRKIDSASTIIKDVASKVIK